jgi:dual specificity tyrosine-phosphorylation-regulated kinase 2/3/4
LVWLFLKGLDYRVKSVLDVDRTGAPRQVVNSRGRRRRAGTKTLAQALHCDEENFVDFITKCLLWDPDKRLKPQNALRHPFITAGRRRPLPPISSSSSSRNPLSSSSSSRPRPPFTETPKKSQIGAPTALAARASGNRLAAGTSVPSTPISSAPSIQALAASTSQSARHRSSYRTEATNGLSHHRFTGSGHTGSGHSGHSGHSASQLENDL